MPRDRADLLDRRDQHEPGDPRDAPVVVRGAARTVFAVTARRAARSGALWGAVFGAYIASSALLFDTTYPTPAARARLAASLGGNAGLSALLGPARRIDTVAGFTAYRTMGVLALVGAIWGLLLATRVLRGEEDAGRWELLLSGPTTRRGAAVQAMAGIAVGVAALWLVTALVTLGVGSAPKVHFTITGSLFLATAASAGAAVFAAVGVVVGQLGGFRRQANAVGAAVLGVSYLVRMVADSSSQLGWLRWASPLGWVGELHPLTGSRPLALVPIVSLVVALAVTASVLAARRDLGAGTLAARDARPPRTRLLGGPTGLSVRLIRPVALGWIAGLAASGLVFGLVAQSAAKAVSGSATVEQIIARLGGHARGAESYLGIAFLTAAAMVAFAAAGQVASARDEEAEGHLDHLLVRPVARTRWLAGRLELGAAVVVTAGVVTGLAAWLGAATQHSGVSIGDLVQAGLNVASPGLFVLGAGALVYGFRPRIAPTVAYGLVAWSFLVELLGGAGSINHWLLDTSVLSHITPAPAASPDWVAAAWLVGLGVLAAFVGIIGFDRRDLIGT